MSSFEERIQNLESELRTAKDSELLTLFLRSKSEDVFQSARKMLLLWLSPVLVAILLIGVNIYGAYSNIRDLEKTARSRLEKLNVFLNDDKRLETLRMLISSFYTIRSIRIPLDFVITYAGESSSYRKSKIRYINARLSDNDEKGRSRILNLRTDHVSSNFPTISVREFYPMEQVFYKMPQVTDLKRFNLLELEVFIELETPLSDEHTPLISPYTYTGHLSSTMVNGVALFAEHDDIEGAFRKFRYPQNFGCRYRKDSLEVSCNIAFDITTLFQDVDQRYKDRHLN